MDIPLSSDALDLALHPNHSNDLLAVGLISGKVQLMDIGNFKLELSGSKAHNNDKKKKKKKKRCDDNRSEDSDDVQDEQDSASALTPRRQLYTKKWSTRVKNKSCRGIDFSHDGSRLWCLSKDKTIYSLDTQTGVLVDSYAGAHEAAPSRLLLLPTEPNLLVTGDDDGVVKLWDMRMKAKSSAGLGQQGSSTRPVRSYDHHFDWITDFHYGPHLIPPRMSKAQRDKEAEQRQRADKRKKTLQGDANSLEGGKGEEAKGNAPPKGPGRERLVCTSGDGTLSVIDFRAPKSSGSSKAANGAGNAVGPPGQPAPGVEVSEDQEDELLSISPVRHGTKLVVGTQLGMLSLWAPSRGLLDHIDRIPGHPASVDCLLPLDESTVLAGSSDGLIRVVQILPHKFLGVVADHGMGLPVERMKRKGGILVSCGHGTEVKVTDIGSLFDDDDDTDEESDGDDGVVPPEEDAEQLARRVAADGDEDASEDYEDVEGSSDGHPGANFDDSSAESDDSDGDDDDTSMASARPPPAPKRPLATRAGRKKGVAAAVHDTYHSSGHGGGCKGRACGERRGGQTDFFADL